MSARLRATLLAAVLFIAFVGIMVVQPTGYAMLSPGPTVNILGTEGSAPVITFKGHTSYPETKGELRILTVYEMGPGQTLTLSSAIRHWLSDDTSVYPESFLYPPGTTQSSSTQEGNAEMSSAQDLAKAAGLSAAGVEVDVKSGVLIAAVPAGPSTGKLMANDVLMSVGGTAVTTNTAAVAAVAKYHPGDLIPLVVMRGNKQLTISIKAGAKGTSGAEAKEPRLGVALGGTQLAYLHLPFPVNISIPDNIMGPSAGMMFALTIYDLLTPGSLTDGHVIAGTGTIDAYGNVGAIGGIDQKIKGAQRDGAQLFLAPASNCDEVVNANYNHNTMKIVKVNTLQDSINAVTRWTKNPSDPRLQGCSK